MTAAQRWSDLRRRAVAHHRHRQQERGPVAPPPCPPGWTVGPPDFVGVGTQKSGTTWWSSLLARHPCVHQMGRKELHYFQHFWDRPFTGADARRYAEYFPRPPGGVSGEWSPRYMLDPGTPGLLAAAAPGARLLVLVRDPVERFRSGLTHYLARNRRFHPRVLVEQYERGRYAEQLARLAEHVDRTRILVLQFERCVLDPVGELRRTWDFLGLPPAEAPPDAGRRVYGSSGPRVTVGDHVLDDVAAAYRDQTARLAVEWPGIDLSLWPSAAGVLR